MVAKMYIIDKLDSLSEYFCIILSPKMKKIMI